MSAEDVSTDTCGATLAHAREAASVTQRDVADALHLPVHVVDAIERGDKTRLPAYVFTRGYVRAYAKLLDLDPDPLVTTLSFEYGARHDDRNLVNSGSSLAGGSGFPASLAALLRKPNLLRQLPVISLAAGAVVVVVAIVLIIGAFSDDAPEQAAAPAAPEAGVPGAGTDADTQSVATDTTSATQMPTVDQAPAAAAPLQTGAGAAPDSANAPQTAPQPADAAEDTAAQQAAVNAGAPAADNGTAQAFPPIVPAAAAPAADERIRRLTETGSDRLTLRFTDECWVEIKNSEGAVLFGDLGQPGQVLEFAGAGPFRVLLGYASGVIMLYNAEPVALTPHTRNNVASLVIGQ